MGKGRPKKPPGEARGDIFRIRVTPAERALFDEAARTKGLDSSAWARSELLTLARKSTERKRPG